MPLLKAEAEKLSNNTLEAGIIEEILDKDELLDRIPFTTINSKAYLYDREATLSEATFIDVNDTVPEGAATVESVTAKLKILIGDVDVDKFLDTTMSDTNSQRATQVSLKAKGLARKFRRTLAIGDEVANPLEFNGIGKLVSNSQIISAGTNGNALSMSMLDELADAVILGADAFIMRPGTLRAYRAALRTLGGAQPDSVIISNFGVPLIAHNGVPILVNDFLPGNEVKGSATATCSVYAVRFNEADGLHGLAGGAMAGIQYEDLGTVQNKDATRSRIKWYCGLALKSTKSLACIRGITNI